MERPVHRPVTGPRGAPALKPTSHQAAREILGLEPDATLDDAKRAYRKLAVRWHPDRNPDDPTAGDRFKEVAAAWQALQSGVPDAPAGPEVSDEVVEAVLRAQTWVERGVLPRYLGPLGRGVPALLGDLASLPLEGPVPAGPGAWLGARATARLAARVVVTTAPWPSDEATALFRLQGNRWEILILPDAFERAGIQGADLHRVLVPLLAARYAQAASGGRIRPRPPSLAPSRTWLLVGLIIAALLTAGMLQL